MKARKLSFLSFGFTLIELLIVVAIIGILAAIAVPNFLNAQIRAKVSRALADLRNINTAMGMYVMDNNQAIRDPQEIGVVGGNGNGLDVWRQLTTPTSYIAGNAFYDPFKPKTNEFSGAAWEAVKVGVYHYRHVDFIRKGGAADIDPTAKYLARSPGPDQWYILNPHRLMGWMAYNPSNGLVSIGDIVVSDKGILGENFPGRPGVPSDF